MIVGCATTSGAQGMNLAKVIMDRAGIAPAVSGMTVNRFCSSALQTIATASNAIMSGQADVIVAGGVESMTKSNGSDLEVDPWLWFNHPSTYITMGATAENVANRYGISRAEQDQFSYESNMKAAKAMAAHLFDDEIIPVDATRIVKDADGKDQYETFVFDKDECPRPGTTLEGLGSLVPSFDPEHGSVTAGNSSQMSDGASFCVIMSAEKADALGLKKLARFVGFATAGVEADEMGIGPVKAVPKVLKLTGMKLEDIDLIELNEAFACQSLYCIKQLGFNRDIVNVNGGAIFFRPCHGFDRNLADDAGRR